MKVSQDRQRCVPCVIWEDNVSVIGTFGASQTISTRWKTLPPSLSQFLTLSTQFCDSVLKKNTFSIEVFGNFFSFQLTTGNYFVTIWFLLFPLPPLGAALKDTDNFIAGQQEHYISNRIHPWLPAPIWRRTAPMMLSVQ
mmetsp:Transcript_7426/g.27776  ORF Transcript_7426/g.27776 Transcript_7426/m.27776 type:complete len:139 (-) Transcript_7426:2751-3167(-)